MGLELYNDIITNKPKYIIDTSRNDASMIFSLNPQSRQHQIKQEDNEIYTPPYQNNVLNFIDTNYQRVHSIKKYDIYLLSTP